VRKSNPGLFEGTCPANTNILFADLKAVDKALKKLPIPGMMVNAKNELFVTDGEQAVRRPVARLESMMQNIADAMAVPSGPQSLPTFVALYDRAKAFSVTKRALQEGTNPYETPESCLYDWTAACCTLFKEACAFDVPQTGSLEQFLEEGPRCSIFFHPALGPLWEVIGQKVSGGKLYPNAELELEIAELYVRNLSVRGSFLLISDSPVGRPDAQGFRHFGSDVGRAWLKNVTIENGGILPSPLSSHLKRSVERDSSCTIRLLGASELIAEDLTISGYFALTVRDGTRVTLRQKKNGGIEVLEEPYHAPSWHYDVQWTRGEAPKLLVQKGAG
jgi:hypothetical protein